MADEGKPDRAKTFADKAKDLEALRASVVDAASVGAGLWISYLFVLFYFLIAAGSVTHRDLLFENPIKLPFLNVELPLVGFFVLAPLLFLIVHAYVLLHFTLLADKVGVFHQELAAQIANDDVRTGLRRQLPSNIFVQLLAGPREVRTGIMGFMLRLIAQISLVAAPLALLVFILLQFLPYHHEPISWWQRLAVIIDLVLLWTLWPAIVRGETASIKWADFRRGSVAAAAIVSIALLLLAFTVATFPGEWLDKSPLTARFIPTRDPINRSLRLMTPHELLVAGDIDFVGRKPTSLWSNRIVLPGIDLIDHAKFDTDAKLDAVAETFSLRGRRLEGAVLIDAKLRKVDFTASRLTGAFLDRADLRGAKFECASSRAKAQSESNPNRPTSNEEGEKVCARLEGAKLTSAQLQGASLEGAHLQGASLDRAQLQGASLDLAELHGATLDQAKLQGASLRGAKLQGASLRFAHLLGASLSFATLNGARFAGAELQGAELDAADVENASFGGVFVWRADPPRTKGAIVVAPQTAPKTRFSEDCPPDRIPCDWSPLSYAALKRHLEQEIPNGKNRDRALEQITIVDPANEIGDEKSRADAWADLARSSPSSEIYLKGLVTQLQAIGCDAATAPYVTRGLIRSVFGPATRNPPAVLAAAFLDEAKCPGARGLSDNEKETLREVVRAGAGASAGPAATAKP